MAKLKKKLSFRWHNSEDICVSARTRHDSNITHAISYETNPIICVYVCMYVCMYIYIYVSYIISHPGHMF